MSDDVEMNIGKEIESDINSQDEYDKNDYYNDENEEYKKAKPTPSIEPPKYIMDVNKKSFPNDHKNFNQRKETFMNFDEKFQKIKNEESLEEEFPSENANDLCESYKIIYNEYIDYSSNSYDIYSKNHLRNTLIEQIKNLDWKNRESEINSAKKETNAFEDIQENFFSKKQACQLANINYLFDKELIKQDIIFQGFPVLAVGDNGGFTDYILYYTIYKNHYNPTIFVIPEKNNSIKDIKYRKEIIEKAEEHVNILSEFFEENKDIDENSKISVDFINDIAKKISEKTDGDMVNLYIARKVINFDPDSSQEIKYKKFLLINTLLAFKCLAREGNFVIKLYDTFTNFTIGLIYFIFKNFESVTIFKPVSTRQYSSARYLVAEKYLKDLSESTNNSIKYLEDYLTKYIEYRNNNYDIKYFLPTSELRRSETFLKIIPEINNGITEKRIDALKEIIKCINYQNTKLYDKMSIKKFFLENWGIPVINYDEKLLLRNQEPQDRNKYGYSKYHSKKIYTEKELIDKYDNIISSNKERDKYIEKLFGNDDKIKKTKKVHKEKEKEKTLDEKYQILDKIVFGKKANTSKQNKEKKLLTEKRERKNSNSKSKNNNSTKKEKEKGKEKYKIGKIEKKNDNKKDDEEEDFNREFDSDNDDDAKDIFKYTSDVKQKLEKKNESKDE
jgi:hypothetical protein